MKKYRCLPLTQGNYNVVVFAVPAKELFDLVKINRREEDKRTGYQRTLLPGRTSVIAKFIDEGNPLPTNIVVAFDKAKISADKKSIEIEETPNGDAGWVIDGQHRLAGASEAKSAIDVAVTGFLGLTAEDQVTQFITINREAKRVPTSLYYDLLPELKTKKSEADIAKERAVDMANDMKVDENSPFYNRIVALKAPSKGQLSLTNFVRKVAPFVHPKSGILRTRTQKERRSVIENYFHGLSDVFPKEYDDAESIFFRTLGFGALMNAFPKVHDITLQRTHKSFKRVDVVETLTLIAAFDFEPWKKLGTGSAAEIAAGQELTLALEAASGTDEEVSTLEV